MALSTINGFSAEEATSKYVYENLFQSIQHINGKGVIDKYTLSEDVRSVNKIDVMRLKPQLPMIRQLGALNNGGYANRYNVGYGGNSPQSVNYSIGVDLFYDRNVPIPASQLFANRTNFEQIVQVEIVDSMTWAINIVTYAKQIEGYFRNGDNFDIAKTHNKGSIVATDITDAELANAVFNYDPAVATGVGSAPNAFIKANANLTDGVPQIGAFAVPVDGRQAFITSAFNADMKSQYSSNASEASANINATGFLNPFTQTNTTRVNEKTGICGMYDGVLMTLFNGASKQLVYIYLGILGTGSDSSGNLPTIRGELDKIAGMIVYGAGTCRGIAIAPTIEVNKDQYNAQSVILAPLMKMGVDVLHGASIKMIVNAGADLASAWSKANIALIMNTIGFTPIDDDGTNARSAVASFGFNTGATK